MKLYRPELPSAIEAVYMSLWYLVNLSVIIHVAPDLLIT